MSAMSFLISGVIFSIARAFLPENRMAVFDDF
jgi:hypothetical protein